MVNQLAGLGAEELSTGRNEGDLRTAQEDLLNLGLETHFLQGAVTDAMHPDAVGAWIGAR